MKICIRFQYGVLYTRNYSEIESILRLLRIFCCLKLMNDVLPKLKPFKNFKHHLATSNGDNHMDLYLIKIR